RTVATSAAAARHRQRGVAAATSASADRASTRQSGACGCSSRSQATATTTSAGALTTAVRTALGMSDLPRPRPLERRREVLALSHDGNRHARRLQPQKRRLRAARATREARSVDVDERDGPARQRALEEPVDEPRLDPGGDDDQLE